MCPASDQWVSVARQLKRRQRTESLRPSVFKTQSHTFVERARPAGILRMGSRPARFAWEVRLQMSILHSVLLLANLGALSRARHDRYRKCVIVVALARAPLWPRRPPSRSSSRRRRSAPASAGRRGRDWPNPARSSWRPRSWTTSPAARAAPEDVRKKAARLKPEGFVLAVDARQAGAAGRLGRRGRRARRPLRRRQAPEDDEADQGRGDPRRRGRAWSTLAGLSDPRPPARIPQPRQLLGRLGREAVRAIHPRAGDLRLQLRREHPVSGRLRPAPSCASPARR